MRRVTRGEGVAREGPRGQTAARGRGSAARGEGLRSSTALPTALSGPSAGLAATVPVGTTVPARQENLPVAWAGRGLRKHAVFIVSKTTSCRELATCVGAQRPASILEH